MGESLVTRPADPFALDDDSGVSAGGMRKIWAIAITVWAVCAASIVALAYLVSLCL